MNAQATKFDNLKSRIKNNPVLASLMVAGVIIIALSSFTDAAKNLLDLLSTESRPDINGTWTVTVTYPWINTSHIETFSLGGKDSEVLGEASYLATKHVILEGSIVEDRIEFKTKSIEYPPEWDNDNTKLATHHYKGRISEDRREFVMETYGGYSSYPPIKFTASKVPVNSD